MSIREINEVRLYGNLVMDPSFQEETSSSQARTYFRMAVNHENRKVDEPWYFDVVCWDRLGKAVARFCEKGKEVYVEGTLESRSIRVDGKNLLVCHIKASRVKFGDSSKKQRAPQPLSSSERPLQSSSAPSVPPEYGTDSLPPIEDPYLDESPEEESNASLAEVVGAIGEDRVLELIKELTLKKLQDEERSRF